MKGKIEEEEEEEVVDSASTHTGVAARMLCCVCGSCSGRCWCHLSCLATLCAVSASCSGVLLL